MPASAAPQITVIVKLPYNRPEGAVDPQAVSRFGWLIDVWDSPSTGNLERREGSCFVGEHIKV